MSKLKPAHPLMLILACFLGIFLGNLTWEIASSFVDGGVFAHIDIWIRDAKD